MCQFLRDQNRKVIERYGLLNPDIRMGVSHPATFVVNHQGVVHWWFVSVSITKRAPNDRILAVLNQTRKANP